MKAKDGIWIIDSEAHTTFLNDRMAEILGVTQQDAVGEDSLAYIFPEDLADARRLFDAKKEGHAEPFRFRLRRGDGSAVWVDVQGTPMYNAAGVFTGVVGTFTVCQ